MARGEISRRVEKKENEEEKGEKGCTVLSHWCAVSHYCAVSHTLLFHPLVCVTLLFRPLFSVYVKVVAASDSPFFPSFSPSSSFFPSFLPSFMKVPWVPFLA